MKIKSKPKKKKELNQGREWERNQRIKNKKIYKKIKANLLLAGRGNSSRLSTPPERPRRLRSVVGAPPSSSTDFVDVADVTRGEEEEDREQAKDCGYGFSFNGLLIFFLSSTRYHVPFGGGSLSSEPFLFL